MVTSSLIVRPPPGHIDYCFRYEWDCSIVSDLSTTIYLSAERLAELVEINRQVNLSVTPAPDLYLYGQEEYWDYPVDSGDCEDYVLEKRLRLMQKGWPTGALLITFVYAHDDYGDEIGHAVLTVRTAQGDLVLDNIEEEVLPWQYSPHRFVARQSSFHSGKWKEIFDPRFAPYAPQVAAQD